MIRPCQTLPVALLVFEGHYRADYPLAVLPLLAYDATQLVLGAVLAAKEPRTQ